MAVCDFRDTLLELGGSLTTNRMEQPQCASNSAGTFPKNKFSPGLGLTPITSRLWFPALTCRKISELTAPSAMDLAPNIDTIGLAHAYNVADNCVRTAVRSGRRIDLAPRRTRRLVSGDHMQRGDRPLGGLRQGDCDLRAVPREECAGNRDKNVERPTWPLLAIRSAGNGDPERAIERGGAADDLVVEAGRLRCRLAADHQEIITVACLGLDRALVRLLDFRDDLDRVRSGLGGTCLVALVSRRLDHRLGSPSLFGADLRRCFLLVVEMDHGRRDVPRTRKQTDQPGRKLPAWACIDRDEQALDAGHEPRLAVPRHRDAILDRLAQRADIVIGPDRLTQVAIVQYRVSRRP